MASASAAGNCDLGGDPLFGRQAEQCYTCDESKHMIYAERGTEGPANMAQSVASAEFGAAAISCGLDISAQDRSNLASDEKRAIRRLSAPPPA
jgi:hypothetical protein